jgi:uncharacterized membrane protein (Fun14 family)
MTDDSASNRPSPVARLVSNALDLGRWQRRLLMVSLLVFGSGMVSQMTSSHPQSPDAPEASIANSKGFLSQSTTPPPPAPEPTLREKVSPWAMKVGASFMGGFLLGFALRTFLRITATVVALGAALFLGISYFGGKNIDLTEARTKYEGAIHWVEDQAYRLKDSAQAHIPHSGTGLIGAFTGFRRKRGQV